MHSWHAPTYPWQSAGARCRDDWTVSHVLQPAGLSQQRHEVVGGHPAPALIACLVAELANVAVVLGGAGGAQGLAGERVTGPAHEAVLLGAALHVVLALHAPVRGGQGVGGVNVCVPAGWLVALVAGSVATSDPVNGDGV